MIYKSTMIMKYKINPESTLESYCKLNSITLSRYIISCPIPLSSEDSGVHWINTVLYTGAIGP